MVFLFAGIEITKKIQNEVENIIYERADCKAHGKLYIVRKVKEKIFYEKIFIVLKFSKNHISDGEYIITGLQCLKFLFFCELISYCTWKER